MKILDPLEAQISLKHSSSNPTPIDPKLITLNSSKNGEEVDSYSHKSLKDDSELFPDMSESLPFDEVAKNEAQLQETKPLGETAENEPSKLDTLIPSCEKFKSLMNPNKLENQLKNCSPGCRLVIPNPDEKCYRFDNFEPDQVVPCAVLSA